MEEAIKNFGRQFDYVPEIVNKENLKQHKHVILLGMGGSHLSAQIAKNINQSLDIWIHKDYGLPEVSEEFLRESLIIASSYSGNTEEVIEGLMEAQEKGCATAVISVGGKLIEIAKDKNIAYIQLPNTGIQPRSALGFSTVALAHLINDSTLLDEIEKIKGKIIAENYCDRGKKIAEILKGKVPVVYSSRKNCAVAYNWKIKFNETGKIPAFFNLFPELNHNEMTGFDITNESKELSERFAVVFIYDDKDHPKISKRMDTTRKLYEERGIMTLKEELVGKTVGERIFSSLLIADWTALYIARSYGAEANDVPMVEEFKKLIA